MLATQYAVPHSVVIALNSKRFDFFFFYGRMEGGVDSSRGEKDNLPEVVNWKGLEPELQPGSGICFPNRCTGLCTVLWRDQPA